MRIFAAMAISAGLFAGPMLAEDKAQSSKDLHAAKTLGTTDLPAAPESVSIPPQDLQEARTLNRQTLPQAIVFERQKVLRAEREAKLGRTTRGDHGEVAADYVGPSARSANSADRMMEDENRVPAPGPKEYRDWRQDKPKQ